MSRSSRPKSPFEPGETLGHPRARCGVVVWLVGVLMFPGAALAAEPTTLDCGTVTSEILGRAVQYCVALPADYASAKAARYPVLYFLHGLFEDEASWGRRGGQQVLDGLLEQGQLGKFLVVLPDGGRTFYVNSFDGRERYEDFFIQEFIPWIDRTYRTIAQPAARGISGTSMGGYGALRLAMRHPDVFGAASAHSAALLSKFPNPLPSEGRWAFYARVLEGPFGAPLNEAYWEANSPLTLAEHPERFAGLKLYFDCGDKDRYGFEEGAEILDRILTAKGFPHEFQLRPGGHGWEYLNQYMKYSLLFHWRWFEKAGGALTAAGGGSAP
jgi:putative tributyrin esterase